MAQLMIGARTAGTLVTMGLVALAGCATGSRTEVRPLMQEYEGNVPGASVLVLRGDEVVYRGSFGMADLEARIAATPATHYRLASVSKQFTAAAILLLDERGSLSLEDRVRKHLPSLPAAADPVTIRHLLTHTSGLVDYEDVMPPDSARQLRDADVLRLLESQPSMYFAPGTDYRYSNSGYALLALIVEKVSGRSFTEFLREEVFGPLDMTTSVAHVEGVTTVANRAYGYTFDDGAWKRTDQSTTSAVLGDGGIYASVDELAHWLPALDSGRFAEAAVPRVATDVEGMHYGYGFRIHEHRGRRVISHTGETIGFRNALVRFPEDKLSVVVLTNRNEGKSLELALKIADRFLER
jgi:CubicO group peptidase (beta-lactamase class C family)